MRPGLSGNTTISAVTKGRNRSQLSGFVADRHVPAVLDINCPFLSDPWQCVARPAAPAGHSGPVEGPRLRRTASKQQAVLRGRLRSVHGRSFRDARVLTAKRTAHPRRMDIPRQREREPEGAAKGSCRKRLQAGIVGRTHSDNTRGIRCPTSSQGPIAWSRARDKSCAEAPLSGRGSGGSIAEYSLFTATSFQLLAAARD
jgi:hypothetical protein